MTKPSIKGMPAVGSFGLVHNGTRKMLCMVIDRYASHVRVTDKTGRTQNIYRTYDGETETYGGLSNFEPTTKTMYAIVVKRPIDHYVHVAILTAKGIVISAGCRRFKSVEKARLHWKARQRHPEAYNRERLANRGRPVYATAWARRAREIDSKLNKFSLDFVTLAVREQKKLARKLAKK